MNNNVEVLIEKGFSELTPDCFDEIMAKLAESPQQQESRTEERNKTFTYERVQVKRRRVVASLATAAVAVMCLVSVKWYDSMMKVTDEIYIDVNPSIVLELNSKGKVVRTEGCNPDGDAVLAASADQVAGEKEPAEVVKALMEEMNNEDYFDENEGTVLISWCTESSEKEAAPLDEVCGAVDMYAADNDLDLTVYTQKIEKTDELKEEAEKEGLSVGRYVFYRKLADENDNVDFDKIKDKKVDEAVKMTEKTDKDDKSVLHIIIEESQPEYVDPTASDEEKPGRKDDPSSEEEKPGKKDDPSSSEDEKPDKPSKPEEDPSSGDEPSSGDDSSSCDESSCDEETMSAKEVTAIETEEE